MADRRQLSFSNWDAVVADMGQTAKHLNDWLRFSMDGFPNAPLPIGLLRTALRNTLGPGMLKKIIAEGKMKDGTPTMPASVCDQPSDSSAMQAAVDELQYTIARFREHSSAIHTSPQYGKMDKATAEKLQLVHFAHHLSWLSPKT